MADKFLNYTQLQTFLNKLKEIFASKSVATTSANGLMAASDKTKLDGIATGATNVTTSTVSGWGYTKNAGTITGIKMNGASKGTSGVVDLGTVITAHQDISGKQDKSTLETDVSAKGFTKNAGTVTGVKINGTTKSPSSGVVDLGTVVTSQYSLPTASTSQLGGVKVDGTTIKINNGVISSAGGGISYEVIQVL